MNFDVQSDDIWSGFFANNLIRALIYTRYLSAFGFKLKGGLALKCLHDVVHFVGLRAKVLEMFVNVDDDHCPVVE